MPKTGIQLGGAYFTIDASAEGLIKTLNDAEKTSRDSVAKIAYSLNIAGKDVERLAQTWLRAEKARADASAAATLKIIKGYNDQADAADKAAKKSQDSAVGFKALATAALGVGSGLAIAHLAIQKVTQAIGAVADETAKASQAQSQLNAMYGASAPVITAFAAAQAQAFGRSRTEGKEAAASVALIADQYALTTTQVENLLSASAELATIKNIPLADAAKTTQAAIAGNVDAMRELAIVTQNDALKALANMTEAERRHFDALSDIGKAQLVLNAIAQKSNDPDGAGAKRLDTLAGSTQNLGAKSADLAETLGTKLAPVLVDVNNGLAGWLDYLDKIIKKSQEAAASEDVINAGLTHGVVPRIGPPIPPDVAPGAINPRGGVGMAPFGPALPTPEQIAAHQADLLRPQLAAAQKAADRQAEAAIKAIDRERAAKEKWYDEERQRIEARRAHQIEAITAARDAAIKALEDERAAQKEADEQAIKDSDRRRDAELKAVDEAHDQVIGAIKSRAAELKRARELEDRDTADRRQRADRTLSDFRAYQDRTREEDHQKELRRIDEQHKRAVRAFEDEATAERKKSDQAARNLDRQAQKEDDRHRKAISNIDAESKAQIDAIQAQIDALDAAQTQDQNASRIASLQKAVADAQAALTKAQGTGTPEQIAAARGDLTAALRGGNDVAIANARERLVQLAGQGADAVKKANEDLQKALKDLQDEQTKEARDAEKDRLSAAQDAIKAKADSEKSAENDRDRRRKADLDAEKQAESDKLADALAKLDKRKGAEATAHDRRVSDINDEYKQGTERLAAARLEQDRALDDRRTKEDRDRADRRDAEDAALAAQSAAADKAREDERNAVAAHYDGPNGVTTQLKEAARQHDLEYSRMLAAEKAAYDAELDLVNKLYHNADGTGFLDQLGAARSAEIDALNQSKADWQEWQRNVSESIKQALDDLNDFIRRGANIPGFPGANAPINPGGGVGNAPYGPNIPGGGPPGSNSVQDWLSEALDTAGAPKNWLSDLTELVALESSGNPGAVNPTPVGKDREHATGLLQTLPSTFRAYKLSGHGDIFNPVDNAIAAIRYIDKTYGSAAGALKERKKGKGYAAGGWITEPVIGRGMRSGAAYTLGEAGPEYVSPSRSIAGSASLLGPGPGMGATAMGAGMSSAGWSSAGYHDNSSINVYGAGTEDVLVQLRREQRRQSLLRGGKAVRRW